MPNDWVYDDIEAYRLTAEIVLKFLKEKFPEDVNEDFKVRVREPL